MPAQPVLTEKGKAFCRDVARMLGLPAEGPAYVLTEHFVVDRMGDEGLLRRVMPPVPVDGPEIEGEGPCLINPS